MRDIQDSLRGYIMSNSESFSDSSALGNSSGGIDIIGYTVEIVTSYLTKNKVATDDIIKIIEGVYNTVSDIEDNLRQKTMKVRPAVAAQESVFDDYIICLEDGRRLKTLKKHLKAVYNMTPEEYKQKWGLPSNYPMVAPAYAHVRSTLAKASGLGKGRKNRNGS